MEPISEEQRDSYFTAYRREALHLETRDIYSTDIERSRFQTWLRGEALDPTAEAEWWRPWFEMMAVNRAAGKTLRRLRVVSEPVTKYIYFEWLDAFNLVQSGEDVRWLPRRRASRLLLPGNDFWMFDSEILTFTHFDGDGHVLDHELTTDPAIVRQCEAAFEAAWDVATPHHEYEPPQA
ncbi:hypothetical protein EV385_4515 [Krasilnikovia cinnamomea]|uniref:DUF6879 domain-containing protein n=1 Tax=Krasilnikovia cinnamomea TaxID=349313 RepID=A0A4Q7ZPJ8_9ACTN|nr:DUF6879 family protein [Krasilnikovia cinnamomea]RZU52641.1 hypothetical protein EV385_4515 [Krasilnikovia cinnamomea]